MVVQNNSATAEESAASSEELSGQADILKEMVGRFQIRNTQSINGSVMKLTGGDFSESSNIEIDSKTDKY